MTAPAPLSGGDARTQPTNEEREMATRYVEQAYAEKGDSSFWNLEERAVAQALADQRVRYERIANERAAEALEQAMREDRTTVSKLSPVEQLTCFLVKGEDLLARAASLRAASREDGAL